MAAFCIAGALRLTEVTQGSLRKVATERIVATEVCSLQCYLIETSLHSTRPLHLQCMYGRATVYEYVVRRDFHFALLADLDSTSLVPYGCSGSLHYLRCRASSRLHKRTLRLNSEISEPIPSDQHTSRYVVYR